jgi:hypothetical protein
LLQEVTDLHHKAMAAAFVPDDQHNASELLRENSSDPTGRLARYVRWQVARAVEETLQWMLGEERTTRVNAAPNRDDILKALRTP